MYVRSPLRAVVCCGVSVCCVCYVLLVVVLRCCVTVSTGSCCVSWLMSVQLTRGWAHNRGTASTRCCSGHKTTRRAAHSTHGGQRDGETNKPTKLREWRDSGRLTLCERNAQIDGR